MQINDKERKESTSTAPTIIIAKSNSPDITTNVKSVLLYLSITTKSYGQSREEEMKAAR